MTAGRPPIYDSAELMQADIDAYFHQCTVTEEPPTVSGLAYALDMSTESLRRYGENDKFCATVKRAKQRIEMYLEKSLFNPSCTGAIFNLKNNFGWKDKHETHHTGAIGVGELSDDELARIAAGSS